MPEIFGPVMTFVAFAIQAKLRGSDQLSIDQAFTSLAIISLVTSPAAKLLTAIPVCASAMGCVDRIQTFLVAPSWDDQRQGRGSPSGTQPRKAPVERTINIELEGVHPVSTKPPGASAIAVVQATVRPSPASKPAIQGINAKIESASLTMIVGPVGSGKSTLMKAILGELPCDKGQIYVDTRRMAYCAQTPWLLNISIQQSICGLGFNEGLAIDEEWYRTVMHACALDQDMLQLPDGDRSIVGSRGLTLSGGQKQRLVCMLYSK